jgi:cytosine/adenosine deaminase-related metal-dependent hydrolase
MGERLYPEAADYLDVYARYGLVGRRSVFGHCIHLPESAWQRLFERALPSRIARRRTISSAAVISG